MVNTVGLKKSDVLDALEKYSGSRFARAGSEENVFVAIVRCEMVVLDLRADDGFSEFWHDRAMGHGVAQKAIDELRMKEGGKSE